MTYPPPAGVPRPDEGYGAPAVCYRHPDRQTGLACTRCGRPICPECLQPAPVGFHCPSCVSEGRASVRRPSTVRTAVARARSRPVVSLTLIGLNVLMYVVTAVQAASINANQNSQVFLDLAMWGPLVDAGELWRLVSSTFLHYGVTHLAVNMLSLYLIGAGIEHYLGRWKYLAVYLVAGIGGSLAVYLFTPMAVAAGASGSVFGLLGAAGVILIRTKQNLNQLIGILVLNLFISFLPGISLAAHAGGLLVGAALTYLLLSVDRRARR